MDWDRIADRYAMKPWQRVALASQFLFAAALFIAMFGRNWSSLGDLPAWLIVVVRGWLCASMVAPIAFLQKKAWAYFVEAVVIQFVFLWMAFNDAFTDHARGAPLSFYSLPAWAIAIMGAYIAGGLVATGIHASRKEEELRSERLKLQAAAWAQRSRPVPIAGSPLDKGVLAGSLPEEGSGIEVDEDIARIAKTIQYG